MTDKLNQMAPHHLPPFITAPGSSDVLFNAVVVLVVVSVAVLGVFFFTIHSLPERYAHRTKKIQLDIVAVLCLLALFTHEHIFWFAALLLAFIDLPDFLTPVERIASAVENMAGHAGPVEVLSPRRSSEAANAPTLPPGRVTGDKMPPTQGPALTLSDSERSTHA